MLVIVNLRGTDLPEDAQRIPSLPSRSSCQCADPDECGMPSYDLTFCDLGNLTDRHHQGVGTGRVIGVHKGDGCSYEDALGYSPFSRL